MKTTSFSQHLGTYFDEYLPNVRNYSPNTIASYQDTFRLLLEYMAEQQHIKPYLLPRAFRRPARARIKIPLEIGAGAFLGRAIWYDRGRKKWGEGTGCRERSCSSSGCSASPWSRSFCWR